MNEDKSINVKEALDLLNLYLHEKGLSRTFIICGGAALILQNIVRPGRSTTDIDIVAPEIDEELREAAAYVADQLGVTESWLNSNPKALAKDMTPDWESRIVKIYSASNLMVYSISRQDMIFAKFYAYCDRQKDLNDIIDLKVTETELIEAADLTRKMDGHPLWPKHVNEQFEIIRKKLGHGK